MTDVFGFELEPGDNVYVKMPYCRAFAICKVTRVMPKSFEVMIPVSKYVRYASGYNGDVATHKMPLRCTEGIKASTEQLYQALLTKKVKVYTELNLPLYC